MAIVLVSDIFGKTPALIELAHALNAEFIVDPYKGVDMAFTNETDAYAYFIQHVGIETYLGHLTEHITTILKQHKSELSLVGFSVGAAAIWRLSANDTSNKINQAFCFYGSQIRNYTEISPHFPVTVIFPKSEPHFDVSSLQQIIATKKQVTVVQSSCFHGFMNKQSSNYNQEEYSQQVHQLRHLLP